MAASSPLGVSGKKPVRRCAPPSVVPMAVARVKIDLVAALGTCLELYVKACKLLLGLALVSSNWETV
jgi:hypothetical protein